MTRWGILGTANIAARAFLPAVRAAGGVATVVGSRTPARGRTWAAEHGVRRAGNYAAVVEASDVDAIYVALPNDQHVEWATAAAATGKAVLCEKPLAPRPDELAPLLAVADGRPVWEAFVFPFHPQTELLTRLVADELGGAVEIHSEFHFRVRRDDDIRLSPQRAGGALHDVGCYPIRLARLVFGAEPVQAAGTAWWAESGVDAEVAALVDFPGERRLVLSAGLRQGLSTFTRVIGRNGELRLSNPFHPTASDRIEVRGPDGLVHEWRAGGAVTAFEHAVRHVHGVLRGEAAPRHGVADDALGQAGALALVRDAL